MKKVILLSLLLAPFAACKKDSVTEVAQPAENIETIFLTCLPQYTSIASTLVRDVLKNGGDVSKFLPDRVNQSIKTHNFLS